MKWANNLSVSAGFNLESKANSFNFGINRGDR